MHPMKRGDNGCLPFDVTMGNRRTKAMLLYRNAGAGEVLQLDRRNLGNRIALLGSRDCQSLGRQPRKRFAHRSGTKAITQRGLTDDDLRPWDHAATQDVIMQRRVGGICLCDRLVEVCPFVHETVVEHESDKIKNNIFYVDKISFNRITVRLQRVTEECNMRFIRFQDGSQEGLAMLQGEVALGLRASDPHYPGGLDELVQRGGAALQAAAKALASGRPVDLSRVTFLAPLRTPEKIICVGLNYRDHSAESGFKQPEYPTLFSRFNSSLIGHQAPIVRPLVSNQLDFEGELVAIIGKGGRHIPSGRALDHVIGYSIFNDASIRDYQFKSPQWTVGKNFDDTGAFGPLLVTSDELPAGAKGLKLQTRLNGVVVQEASTTDMVFDVATLIATISEAMTLKSGDVIVTGTPSGVGLGRKPPLFMKEGDIVEVEIEKIGVLSNSIVNERA